MEPTGAYARPGYRSYVLIIMFILFSMSFIDRTLVGILAPVIKADLKLSDSQLGLVTGASFALIYAAATLPFGWLADRYRRNTIIVSTLAIWGVCIGLFGMASTFLQLLLARAGTGIGEGGGTAPVQTLLIDSFPLRQRSRMFAIYGFGVPVGVAAAGLIGGPLSGLVGWRMTFILTGAVALTLAVLIKLTIVEPQRILRPGESDKPEPFLRGLWIMVSNSGFMLVSLGVAFASIVGVARFLWIPSFMTRSFGLGYVEVGVIFGLIQLVAGISGGWIGGSISDRLARHGPRAPALVSAGSYIVAAPFLVGMLLTSDVRGAWICFFMVTLFESCALGPNMTATQHFATARLRSTASAIMTMFVTIIAMGLGVPLIGLFSDLLAPAFSTESLRYALFALPVCYVISTGLFVLGSRRMHDPVE